MLDHVASRVPPVVEDLRTENMPSHSPHRLVPLSGQPVVSQLLGIEVVNFEGAVVHMRGLVRAHEEGVVVNGIASPIDVGKDCYVHFLAVLFHVEEVTRDEVEVPGVEVEHCRKILYAVSKVTKLFSVRRWVLLVKMPHTLCTGAGPTLNR